jgi:hypothetical protein
MLKVHTEHFVRCWLVIFKKTNKIYISLPKIQKQFKENKRKFKSYLFFFTEILWNKYFIATPQLSPFFKAKVLPVVSKKQLTYETLSIQLFLSSNNSYFFYVLGNLRSLESSYSILAEKDFKKSEWILCSNFGSFFPKLKLSIFENK